MKDFRTKDGLIIENVSEYVSEWLVKHPESEIYIGCDSQEVGSNVNYVTTICLYEFGKGAHVIHCKEIEPRPKKGDPIANMHPKLWSEVVRSVNAAEMLKDIDTKITVHVDYNSKPSEKSNQLYEAGIGYAKSMGYDAVGKPHAWAASNCADNYCR